ncbi:TonB-dependent receptor [Methylophaga sp. OBS1]|uniref:TonB-dependent receptor n=1 Tax=Methylophaga sp. OBS1 TaxID=2991933 RepID=UPI002259EE88|nr:TonB-dependent receptor [Methylophaga sp. OBS1]MCX4193188.1 TonB-dependent receptor [Methylophaga sp. OBS1]
MQKTLIASLLASLTIAPAQAETEANRMSPLIVVGATPSYETNNLAGSVDSISRDELAISHVDDTMELFSKVPGVYFARYNQGIINTDIGIRGFAAEGSTPHAKLLIDGIPANLHNGYSEMDQLFPANIESVQVYKGSSDPRYGLFNVAGNYNIETRSDLGREVEATYGSFNAREIQAYAGEQSGRLTHSYFAGYREADGYRDNEHIKKYSVSGRWFYDFTEATTLGFIARVADYDADAAGYLPREEARKHPTRSADYARLDGGDKQTQSFSLHLDHAFTEQLDWSLKSYFNHYERERWVRFSEGADLQNRFDDQDHYGVISTLSWQLHPDWEVRWGVDAEKQEVLEQRFGTVGFQRQRDNNDVIRDYDFSFVTYGSYLQLSHMPVDWLAWNVALRGDRIRGEFTATDNSGQQEDRNIYDFGTIVQPKANLFLYPSDDVTLFVNYGRSFQHPFSASAYTTGNTAARDVSINDGWEAGVKWRLFSALQLRASYWEQKASDEFVLVDGLPRNVGETERTGVDFGFDWDINDKLILWGNIAGVETEIQTDGTNKGNELRSIPDYTASLGLSYQVVPDLTWRVHLDSQSGSYANEENIGGKYGHYNLVNTSLDYATSWGNINVQVNNLFNEYYEYVYDQGSPGTLDTIHSPGNGINASVSVAYHF